MAPTVVVGVGAGIAAYKAAILVRALMRAGVKVHVVPTPRSLDFVGRTTWEGLSGQPVLTGVADLPGADHVELARVAQLIVIAPATADLIARLRSGVADDLLTTSVLAAHCPVLIAPAMHSNMWTNPATQDNVRVLRERGVHVLDPDTGALGSGDSGIGRLVDPETIAKKALELLGRGKVKDSLEAAVKLDAAAKTEQKQALAGARILITAGGTREPIDPVRFIGNCSSGRQGIEIAKAAFAAGAQVTLFASNIESEMLSELDSRIDVVPAPSSIDVEEAVMSRLKDCDALVMAAAIADFKPEAAREDKIKKDPDSTDAPILHLVRTTDILRSVCVSKDRPKVVLGFAAETGTPEDVLNLGTKKALRKGADLLAVNRVGGGAGFGEVDNEVWLLDSAGLMLESTKGSKSRVAQALVSAIGDRLARLSR
ncbi:bifunctional phosphopantothenoylcysteine decarboxylase/phosphopantothenate--cysteine ligase CoaBC [Schaalia cardiffensis]|uniref:bifunctional phosphopantothenoylcysteine decarboxylase/phosphopantothenate--cysteine ligase CoaBC n=1 Tax=Schaalia cardiffensis TaxID=181487 RepID=UPI0018E7CF7E|nr:bifunctional phosphopantothenoylcysteine decarboxylase/phosphopantothenate--cysteine ligase CoaBC [Schaalia cardiffensis]MBJ2329582.1 bifunctional phosphopantothenoylcysteine decarboxylase/phosphopantothenate--cysteine ligase CoaBC [Schaalia cardiffensis]